MPTVAALTPLLVMTLAGQDALVSQSSRASRTVLAAPTAATMVVAPVAMAIAGFDTDGDGRTSRAELTAGIARSFAAVDTGHSGSLRYLDYAEWALRYLGDRNALPSPFEVDANGDDRISLAELQAAFAAAFDRMDTNHDGSVSRAELLTIREGRVPDDGRGGKRRGR